MRTRIIEATTGPTGNHGKFLLGAFDAEWRWRSVLKSDAQPLLMHEGWSIEHLLVTDLATGEGALFRLGGFAPADLNKHRIWVCPLFEPFLTWLYARWPEWLSQNAELMLPLLGFIDNVPDLVTLTFDEAPFSMVGSRGKGDPTEALRRRVKGLRPRAMEFTKERAGFEDGLDAVLSEVLGDRHRTIVDDLFDAHEPKPEPT